MVAVRNIDYKDAEGTKISTKVGWTWYPFFVQQNAGGNHVVIDVGSGKASIFDEIGHELENDPNVNGTTDNLIEILKKLLALVPGRPVLLYATGKWRQRCETHDFKAVLAKLGAIEGAEGVWHCKIDDSFVEMRILSQGDENKYSATCVTYHMEAAGVVPEGPRIFLEMGYGSAQWRLCEANLIALMEAEIKTYDAQQWVPAHTSYYENSVVDLRTVVEISNENFPECSYGIVTGVVSGHRKGNRVFRVQFTFKQELGEQSVSEGDIKVVKLQNAFCMHKGVGHMAKGEMRNTNLGFCVITITNRGSIQCRANNNIKIKRGVSLFDLYPMYDKGLLGLTNKHEKVAETKPVVEKATVVVDTIWSSTDKGKAWTPCHAGALSALQEMTEISKKVKKRSIMFKFCADNNVEADDLDDYILYKHNKTYYISENTRRRRLSPVILELIAEIETLRV